MFDFPITDISVTPLYTRSNRGAIQMVMNRFIYYLHHTSFGKQKRRWRCIMYRRQRCTAYIDTNGELITSRLVMVYILVQLSGPKIVLSGSPEKVN